MITCIMAMLANTTAYADKSCEPNQDPVYQAFKCTTNPCVVGDNIGGSIPLFVAAYYELLHRDWTVILTGLCGSSCILAADWGRNFFKITPRTQLGFHMAREYRDEDVSCVGSNVHIRPGALPKRYYDPPHSPDIRRLVYAQRSGFPRDDVWYISASQLQIWPLVEGEKRRKFVYSSGSHQ